MKDEELKLAREAGKHQWPIEHDFLKRFEALIRADEREQIIATQRQWVGLTDEEHTQIAIDSGCMSAEWVFYGAAVERKVKEKNF